MENFIKKKYIIFEESTSKASYGSLNSYFGLINKNDFLISNCGFITLNKNHISEILENSILPLNLRIKDLYEYISFCTGRKHLLLEKKSDLKSKINDFENLKYQQIIMSNGNNYYVIIG